MKYLIKRLIWFIPTLLLISLITFSISQLTPGDPIERRLSKRGESQFASVSAQRIQEIRAEYGLDLPVFYFSLRTMAHPDTLHRIPFRHHRKLLDRLVRKTGHWPSVQAYYQALRRLEAIMGRQRMQAQEMEALQRLFYTSDIERLHYWIDRIAQAHLPADIMDQVAATQTAAAAMLEHRSWKRFLPGLQWHGRYNQYHRWFFGLQRGGIIRGDWGISIATGGSVSKMIAERLPWTLLLALLAIILTYSIAIPLGMHTAMISGSRRERWITAFLFMLYSVPVFWAGTMLLVWLGGGDFLHVFPIRGLGRIPESASWLEIVGIRLYHLVLPVVCLTYPSLAYITRQTSSSMSDIRERDYIRSARAVGVDRRRLHWRHIFPNGVLPLITLLAYVFPFAVTGSLMVEMVFSIPGMGDLMLDSLKSRDYPVIYATAMLVTLMTMLGMLCTDLLYSRADPRIRYDEKA